MPFSWLVRAASLVGAAACVLVLQVGLAQSWLSATTMPTPRSEGAAAVVGSEVFVVGGLDRFGRTLDSLEILDTETGRWRKGPDLPLALHHTGVAALDGRICASGGYRTLGFLPDVRGAWCYDPSQGRWEEIADMPGPRAAHAMVAVGDRLLVLGGRGPAASEVWAWSPAEGAWRVVTELPTPREHLAAAVLGGEVYVVGGRWPGEGNLAVLEIYDPQSGRWRRGASMATPRSGLATGILNGRLYVTGGEAFDPPRTFDETEAYDPASDTWAPAPALPTARHGAASATANGRWYVIGGGPEAGLTVSGLVEWLSLGTAP